MDQKILDHILNKDWEQAFKLLVKDYHQRVYWQIRRMVLIHEDADDIAQNVFIKIYQNLNSFKNESKLSTWIFRITYNETINFIHKNAKEQNVSFEDYSMNIADDLSTDEYYDEMKYEQISEISGTSVGALKASYHHAVAKIKEFLEDED